MEKEAFWTFSEHKSEEIEKVPRAAEKRMVTASSHTLTGQNTFSEIYTRRRQEGHPGTLVAAR